MSDLTKLWQNILIKHKMVYDAHENSLRLIDRTSQDVVATGKSPSVLLDNYFVEQVFLLHVKEQEE